MSDRNVLNVSMQVGGFALAVLGIGMWSIAAACVAAGIVLFVAGGLGEARSRRG